MKFSWLALCLIVPLTISPAAAKDPEVLTPAFRQRMIDAITAYRQKDFDTAKVKVEEAERVQPNTTAAANMQGAIAMELNDYDEARAAFERALEIDPDFFPAKFNLCEIPFQKKQYGEARELYKKLPTTDSSQSELVQYKIFMTYLLQKMEKEAQETLDAIKFPSDTPAYYFAHAAWNFAHENRKEAESWVQSATRIFPPHVNLIFAETLEELGWLKRGQAAAETPET